MNIYIPDKFVKSLAATECCMIDAPVYKAKYKDDLRCYMDKDESSAMIETATQHLNEHIARCVVDHRNGALAYNVLTVEGMLRQILEDLQIK